VRTFFGCFRNGRSHFLAWVSAAGGRGSSWIFIHDTVDRGLIVLFSVFFCYFSIFFFRSPPLGNFSADALAFSWNFYMMRPHAARTNWGRGSIFRNFLFGGLLIRPHIKFYLFSKENWNLFLREAVIYYGNRVKIFLWRSDFLLWKIGEEELFSYK